MTYKEYKTLMQLNANNPDWFYDVGIDLVNAYPEYADQFIVESLTTNPTSLQTKEVS